MTARVAKHEHRLAIISHYDDWSTALAMCQAKPCGHTVIMKPIRINVSGPNEMRRRFRPETTEEYRARVEALPHLCCE